MRTAIATFVVVLLSLQLAESRPKKTASSRAASSACRPGKACIELVNQCQFDIWPGIQGSPLVANGGLYLPSRQSHVLEVPYGWTAGRIWARTGCDENFNCDTGFCGNALECAGWAGDAPVTVAEFTLSNHGYQDYYDVSLVDGYNVPILIDVVQGTGNATGGEYDCKRAGGCGYDLNSRCPSELTVRNKYGRAVGCNSACTAFGSDEYCCLGNHNDAEVCTSEKWPVDYSALFKKACPNTYTYAYDDSTSQFFCRGLGGPSPSFRVQFC